MSWGVQHVRMSARTGSCPGVHALRILLRRTAWNN